MAKKNIFLTILLLCSCLFAYAYEYEEEEQEKIHYIPKIQGTIRAKYEYNSSVNGHRFQVRNARFCVNGNISPFIWYKAEVDLSDEGVMKMLDAYIKYTPSNWAITFGQQKVPFSTENLRSPHLYYFANRSFIGKQMSHDVRDVGLMVSYSYPKNVPFSISAGIYNGTGIYNQKEWQNTFNYAARASVFPISDMQVSVSFNSVKPDEVRMNLFDASFLWQIQDLHLETEYVYKIYDRHVFDDTQAFLAFASYDIATPKIKFLKKISPVLRYDMMTDSNKGIADDAGNYAIDDNARQRITGGFIFSLNTPFVSDIRLNYEQYFYKTGIVNADNKLVLECVVRF